MKKVIKVVCTSGDPRVMLSFIVDTDCKDIATAVIKEKMKADGVDVDSYIITPFEPQELLSAE